MKWTILFLCLISTRSFGGPTSSGGGGNFCYLHPGAKPVLLDMVTNQGNVGPENNLPGVRIDPSPGSKFRYLNPVTPVLRARIEMRLQTLAHQMPTLYSMIMSAVDNSWYLATQDSFAGAIGASFTSAHCHAGNTRAAIGFFGGLKFVMIDAWNSASLDTQAYTVIHEAGRLVSLFLRFTMGAKDLQEFVRNAVINPSLLSRNEGLNNSYLNYVGLENHDREQACLHRRLDLLFEKVCAQPLTVTNFRNEVSEARTRQIQRRQARTVELLNDWLDKMALRGLSVAASNVAMTIGDFVLAWSEAAASDNSSNRRKFEAIWESHLKELKGLIP